MAGSLKKTFIGFGFGPIQSALFLYEAYMSKNFSRFVVADIDRELVDAVKSNRGCYSINIARKNCIDQFTVEGMEIFNTLEPEGFKKVVDAVSESDEICTALPSVNVYSAGDKISVVSAIRQGLLQRDRTLPTIIYTAENNNRAAEILLGHISQEIHEVRLKEFQVLNTVIGKMSGVITDQETIERMSLATITPEIPRAVLVEEFNRILVSRVLLKGYRRGIDVFVEKGDLLPFEEAKLFGHNAIHALIAYLADIKGYYTIADAGKDAYIMEIARRAFIEESGAALIKRHEKLHDSLFTEEGYRDYADDLLKRMINPNLNDLVERVGRDHARKLGIEDRLYGTMVLALENGIEPKNLALGAAAGIISMMIRRKDINRSLAPLPKTPDELTEENITALLTTLWGQGERAASYGDKLISLTREALKTLHFRKQMY